MKSVQKSTKSDCLLVVEKKHKCPKYHAVFTVDKGLEEVELLSIIYPI
jgi:hypothetical protein